MSDNKTPFADFDSLFKQMQVPGLDMDAMMAAYRKNVEAVAAATQAVNEGMQALIRRQAEIIKDSLEQMRVATAELSSAKDSKELTDRQAEIIPSDRILVSFSSSSNCSLVITCVPLNFL